MEKFILNKKYLFLAIVLIFGAFYIFNFVSSYEDISLASGGTQEDFILEYIAGENFVKKGFSSLNFLPDYSVDIGNESNPIFYTHNPPLPSVVQGLLIKIGFNVFSSRIFYSLLSLLGIALLYLFLAEISSIWIALFSSIFLIINYSGFLSIVDHNQYSLGFLLFFGYLFLRSLKINKKYVLIPIIFFIASLSSYMLLGFMVIVEFFYMLFEGDKKLFLLSFTAGLSGGILHLLQNFIALGVYVGWQDVWLTFTNRFFGFPTREEMLSFYQDNNLVLWESSIGIPFISYLKGAIMPFYLFKTPFVISFFAFIVFWLKKSGHSYKNRNFLFSIFLTAVVWQFVFFIVVGAYPLIFHLFVVVFLGFVLGDLLNLLFEYVKALKEHHGSNFGFGKIFYIFIIIFIISFSSFKYFTWAGHGSRDENLYKTLEMSERYKGKTFFTNTIPHLVSFKTENWAIGSCPAEGLLNLDPSVCYSKFIDFEDGRSLSPDYILLSSYSPVLGCDSICLEELKDKLSGRYKLIEDDGYNLIYSVGGVR